MTSETGQFDLREWAMRRVQWNPARNAIKYGVLGFAEARGLWYQRTGQVPEIANIVTASSAKAGSQWMKALIGHPVVRAHTGLFTLPQLDFKLYLDRPFPAGTFVGGFGWPYPEYVRVPKPFPHRVIYMFRDPRDMLVSGYYSAVKTHRKLWRRKYEDYRDRLRAMPIDDALLDMIVTSKYHLLMIASWVDVDDPEVAKFRLEDVGTDPEGHVVRILEHCGVHLSDAELDTLLGDVSREALQAKDLAQRKDGESHYRVDRKGFRELFKPEHYDAMESIVPGLCARLGYPD
jgi:Sulfotransferase domain